MKLSARRRQLIYEAASEPLMKLRIKLQSDRGVFRSQHPAHFDELDQELSKAAQFCGESAVRAAGIRLGAGVTGRSIAGAVEDDYEEWKKNKARIAARVTAKKR